MKNSICEKMIWYALSLTIFRFIEQYWKDIDIKSIKRLSKDNYKAMISRTPDIGSFRKNPLRIPIYDVMEKLGFEKYVDKISENESYEQEIRDEASHFLSIR